MDRVVRGFECQSCNGFVIAQELVTSDQGGGRICPKDGGSVVPTQFCEKTGWQCPSCKLTSRKPDECKKCGQALEKVTDRAKVVDRCTKCKTNYTEAQPGNKCPTCKKGLKPFCEKSGKFPHGTDPTNCGK